MSNFSEAGRQDVLDESANKLVGCECDSFAVFGGEGNTVFVDGLDALVGDADAVCVASEVLENLFRSRKRLFGVDDPIGFIELIKELGKVGWLRKRSGVAVVFERHRFTQAFESIEKLTAKECSEDHNGKDVVAIAANPCIPRRRESTPCDDAVEMRMKVEFASPCVQNSG